MPTFDFTSPQGQQYSIEGPEGSTPQEAFTRLQGHLSGAAAPQPEAPQETSSLGGVAKSVASGLGSGVTGLAGLPADVANLGAQGIDYLAGSNLQKYTQPVADVAGGTALQKDVEGVTGKFYQPKGTLEKYAKTIGEFLPAAIGGPESLAAKVATRVIPPAVASETAGQMTEGTGVEPLARMVGGMAGAGLPHALSRGISPATINPERQGAVDLLTKAGVDMSAATKTGSKAMGYLESELGNAAGAGGKATASNRQTMETYTQAALKAGGVVDAEGKAATNMLPETVQANADNIGTGFNSIAAKYHQQNPIILDPSLRPALDQIVDTLRNQGQNPGTIAGFMKRLGYTANQQTSAITGETYQSISSELSRMRRGATNSDFKYALDTFKGALNDAVQSGLAPADQGVWQGLRTRYLNHLILRDAVKTTTEPAAEGMITPTKLTGAINKFTKTGYTSGTNDLEPLARAGNQVLKSLPDSGTAARASARTVTGLMGGAAAGHFGLLPGVLAGIAGPAIAGRAIFTKPVQKYLTNQAAVGMRRRPLAGAAITGGVLGSLGGQ